MNVHLLIDLPVPDELHGQSYAAATTALRRSPGLQAKAMAADAGVERQRWAAQHATTTRGFDHLLVVATATATAHQSGHLPAAAAVRQIERAAIDQHHLRTIHLEFDPATPTPDPAPAQPPPLVDVVALALAPTLDLVNVGGEDRQAAVEHVTAALAAVGQAIAGLRGCPLAELATLDAVAQVRYLRQLLGRRPKDVPPPAWYLACGTAHRRPPPSPTINGRWPVVGPVPTWLATGSTEAAPPVQYRWGEWVKRLLAQPALLAEVA